MRIVVKKPTVEGRPLLDKLDDRQFQDFMQKKTQREFEQWDKKLAERTGHVIAFNNFMSENAKPWGKIAGINSGNGQFEGRMSLSLLLALSSETGPFKGDPDWWKDDAKFYRWMREHPWHDGRPGKHRSQGAIHDPGGPQL